MERVRIDGAELEYEVQGTGEPVVLVHGSHIADAFAPLLAEPALTERYQLVMYHRRGFAGCTRAEGPLSIEQQAADCHALIQHLGVQRAHVAGYSYGGPIVLQLALDAPEVVHSLALLEPALFFVPSTPQLMEAMDPAIQMYGEGDKRGAIDSFLQVVFGPEYRSVLDRVLPGPSNRPLPTPIRSSRSNSPLSDSGASPRRTQDTSRSRFSPCSGKKAIPSRRLRWRYTSWYRTGSGRKPSCWRTSRTGCR